MYARNGDGPSGQVQLEGFGARNPGCQLGDTLYHKVDLENIPSGCTSAPVKVDDNGTLYETCMVAGSVGIRATSSGGLLDKSRTHGNGRTLTMNRTTGGIEPYVYQPAEISGKPGLDSLKPESGWWMYELKEGKRTTDSTGQKTKDSLDKRSLALQMGKKVQNQRPRRPSGIGLD